MPTLKIAHIRDQGNDMIIIPLDRSFDIKSSSDQRATIKEMQARAKSAGLDGTVVAIWEAGGRTKFIAPRSWHSFFNSINLMFVWNHINAEISW